MKKERFNCIDDLPLKKVDNLEDPKYYLYKCRTNWWQSIINRLEVIFKLTDNQSVKKEIGDFLAFTEKINWSMFRTREEIDRANSAIDKVIAYLEEKNSPN